ncbi:MAG: phage portal protein [Chthoniobacteraceae bacterium]|nr:phage portal protein [Chthoniobacteraceae bacterium]
MPPTRPLLYGPNNKPLSLNLYPSIRNNPRQYRPRPRASKNLRSAFSAYDRSDALDTSRQLVCQNGTLGSAIRDKNAAAFGDGWDAHYLGSNSKWGEAAMAFLNQQFFPNSDRLGRHTWRTGLKLSGMAWDRDGDDLMILTEDDNGSGFPKIEIIPATRIGNGDRNDNVVSGGPFDGAEIYDGIIFNAAGRAIGVRVLGRPSDLSLQTSNFTDFSLGFGGSAELSYNPEFTDQARGIPIVTRVVRDWADLEDVDEFLKRGIKRAASIGLISKTADGEAGLGNEVMHEEEVTDVDGETKTVQYEEVEGGEMYYLQKDGEDLEALKFETPHPNVENFIKRIERRGLAAVGWFYELLNLGDSGRAASRLVCDLANTSIWQQQEIAYRRTMRATRYALAKAMKNGFLIRNPDPMDAYFSWEFGLPKQISVDAGNDKTADREGLKMGVTNEAIIAQKDGNHWKAIRRQRLVELKSHITDAEEIVAASAGKITFDRAMELIEQRTANGALASNPGQKPTPKP